MKNLIKKILGKDLTISIKILFLKFTKNYLTSSPKGKREDYLDLHKQAVDSYKDNIFIKENFTENEIKFINELAKKTQISIKKSLPNFFHGFLIYNTLKSYILKHAEQKITIFETGTAKGFSSTLMSYCANNYNANYEIHTTDILPNDKKIFWNSITDTYIGQITRKELLEEYNEYLPQIFYHQGNSRKILKQIDINKINFAFLDGSHEYEDCKLEFDFIDKRNSSGDIVIFDDYTKNKFSGICKVVDEIVNLDKYSFKLFEENQNRGYAILTKK